MNNEITRERLEQVVKEAAERISSELLLDDGSLIDPYYMDLCCTGSIVDALIVSRFRSERAKAKISLPRMQGLLRDRGFSVSGMDGEGHRGILAHREFSFRLWAFSKGCIYVTTSTSPIFTDALHGKMEDIADYLDMVCRDADRIKAFSREVYGRMQRNKKVCDVMGAKLRSIIPEGYGFLLAPMVDGRILLSVTCANETVSEFITEDAIHHLGEIARRLADELSDEKK